MTFDNAPQQVALVEDDGPLRTLLARTLRENGFEVTGFASAAEFRPAIEQKLFDLVVLDVMLPGSNGLDICRWLRERYQIPIIFMSARGSQTDRIVGLELGADDYIVKPVDPAELIARIRAVLRRSGLPATGEQEAKEIGTMSFEGWLMDLRRRELFAPDGERIAVSEAEFDLLAALAEMPQRIVSRGLLLERSRGRLASESDRSVDVLISRLRRKLGSASGGGELIRTVRGLGYVFVPRVTR